MKFLWLKKIVYEFPNLLYNDQKYFFIKFLHEIYNMYIIYTTENRILILVHFPNFFKTN